VNCSRVTPWHLKIDDSSAPSVRTGQGCWEKIWPCYSKNPIWENYQLYFDSSSLIKGHDYYLHAQIRRSKPWVNYSQIGKHLKLKHTLSYHWGSWALDFSGSTSGRGLTAIGVADDLFVVCIADADVVPPPAGPVYIIFLTNRLHIWKKSLFFTKFQCNEINV